jgi:hypothetical protein
MELAGLSSFPHHLAREGVGNFSSHFSLLKLGLVMIGNRISIIIRELLLRAHLEEWI